MYLVVKNIEVLDPPLDIKKMVRNQASKSSTDNVDDDTEPNEDLGT